MIKLSGAAGSPLYVSPEKVLNIYEHDGTTRINMGDPGFYFVTESPEEVVRKIMDYKLLRSKLDAFYNTHAIDPEDERAIIYQIRLIRISLDNLAGLDGDPDAK